MDAIINEVIKNFWILVDSKKEILTNPLNIIALGMEVMNKYKTMSGVEKKNILLMALTTIANGSDNLYGTQDDVIPEPIIRTIKSLMEGNIINHMVDLVADISKGRFDIGKGITVVKEAQETCNGCFSFIASQKGKKYTK